MCDGAFREAFYDDKSGNFCIVTDYAEGGDMLRLVSKFAKMGQLLPEETVWKYLLQALAALAHLHSLQVVHRDIKNANLLLSKDKKRVYLGDLNVSSVLKGKSMSLQVGTPIYASPEVFANSAYNSKSDIWSLGCSFYELCAQKPPFQAKNFELLYSRISK